MWCKLCSVQNISNPAVVDVQGNIVSVACKLRDKHRDTRNTRRTRAVVQNVVYGKRIFGIVLSCTTHYNQSIKLA
jgi:hypothetical protein